MIKTPRKLLSAAELRRLRVGSYEEKIEEARRVLDRHYDAVPYELLATRDGEAVVLSEGRCVRAAIGGDACMLMEVDVESYDPVSARELLEREAVAVAGLAVRGETRKAVQRLEEVVRLAAKCEAPLKGVAPEVLKVQSRVRAPVYWQRVYQSRREQIEAFLGEELQTLQEARLISDLRKLYDGAIGAEKLEDYEDEVEQQLAITRRRWGALEAQVAAAVGTVCAQLSGQEGEGLKSFLAFAESLREDLRELCMLTDHAMVTVDGARSHGKLCDVLAEGLYDREVAGRFVTAAADRLNEAD